MTDFFSFCMMEYLRLQLPFIRLLLVREVENVDQTTLLKVWPSFSAARESVVMVGTQRKARNKEDAIFVVRKV